MTPAEIIAALKAPRGDAVQRRGDHAVDYPGSKSRARDFADGDLIARPAAVLVPLVKRINGLHVILTRRTDHLSDHAGQISFPGGRQDKFDVTIEETAILNPGNQKLQTVTFEGTRRRYFAIPYREYYIWGATAGMLVNFSEVLRVSRTEMHT